MNELFGLDTLIYATLTADAALVALASKRVFSEVGPEGITFPYVLYSFQSGSDQNGVGGVRIFSRPVYRIEAVDKADSFSTAAKIADRIDKVLQNVRGQAVVNGVTYQVDGCVRRTPVRIAEEDQGVRYNRLGGLYVFYIYPIAGS